ncbi:unnamed protein product [Lactuca virosa]|uniref:Disease resistance protein At4g27190-like leucine-rich repeats domain-containing protein n=1 Tax=Lactuca virosa TaxID=75947 RepID=A0AAU9M5G0_9ASTR|nr:unnamed protein product [Lactuca virosa]
MESKHSFENTLKLVTKKSELLGSRINELFEKTVVLCLSVDNMSDLEDVWMKSSLRSQSSSFQNIRILVVSECAELEYLFTLGVAKAMSNLEHLDVFNCLVMKELIHLVSGEEKVTFPKLTFLSLRGLPELLGLCQNVNTIALPHLVELKIGDIPNIANIYSKNKLTTSCLLREEVLIPKLQRLHIEGMENLKEIWPCDFGTSEEVTLREIEVSECENLVNIFPCNPMPLLCHLEELKVRHCGSIEALFNINMDYVVAIEESSISLRRINVFGCDKLVDLFPCNPMPLLHHLEELEVRDCGSIEALFSIDLDCVGETGEEGGTSSLRSIEVRNLGKIKEVWRIKGANHSRIPICGFQAVESIKITGLEVIFETLDIWGMERMSHVWKCNWNEFLILHRKPSESPFHNLTTINLKYCKSIKYVFSPLMGKLLSNLKEVKIGYCDDMEEVVSNRDDEDEEKITSTSTHTSTSLFPLLDSLSLYHLQNLKCIGGGGSTTTSFLDQYKEEEGDGDQTTKATSKSRNVSFPYLKTIKLVDLPELMGFFLGMNEFQWPSLDKILINDCPRMRVFTAGGSTAPQLKYVKTRLGKHSPRCWFNSHVTTTTTQQHQESTSFSCPAVTSEEIHWSFHNLIELHVTDKTFVEKIIIPSNELLHLKKLEKIYVRECASVEEVFEAVEGTRTNSGSDESQTTIVTLPNLTQVELVNLDCLTHIWKSNRIYGRAIGVWYLSFQT